jgi:hypothetical protein
VTGEGTATATVVDGMECGGQLRRFLIPSTGAREPAAAETAGGARLAALQHELQQKRNLLRVEDGITRLAPLG